MTGYTERPETPLDELIQRQAMDRRVAPRRTLDDILRSLNESYVRTVLNERCAICRGWLDDAGYCHFCKGTT